MASDSEVEQAFRIAYQHQQGGRLSDAEAVYGRIVAVRPDHAKSLHYLGLIAAQSGRREAAVDLIRRAIAARPDYAEAYSNLGNVLAAAGRVDEAIAAHREALALRPAFPEALSNLGNALIDRRDLVDAVAAFRQAIRLRPDYPEAHNNLGTALHLQGQSAEAIAAYGRAVGLRPGYGQAWRNLGNTLVNAGRPDDAIAAYGRAVAVSPDDADALAVLGDALQRQGRLGEAVAALGRAAALRPRSAEGQLALGQALLAAGRADESVAALRRAVDLRPDLPGARISLGDALLADGRPDEASAACRLAIAARPDEPQAYTSLGNALKDQGRVEEAVDAYRQAVAVRPDYWEADSNAVYSLHFHPGYDAAAIAAEHRRWDRCHARPLCPAAVAFDNDPDPDRRLRVGYVSPNFRDHVVGRNLLPLFEGHDHGRVEVTCYSQATGPDAMTARFRATADRWRETAGLSDAAVADLVRADRIDVLVDLTLHMAGHRLLAFARRPAPVQVTFAGDPGSTGMGAIDYRLSDPHLDPPGSDESVYAERTVRLPDTFWCYDPHDGGDVPVSPLPALAGDPFTFGCLNNFCKVNGAVLSLWARVLAAVPRSRLLLSAAEGTHRRAVGEVFERSGVAAGRVEFVPRLSHRDYLGLHQRIDLGLDTFPYNGHTTSLDGLWMGVPAVSLVGRTVVGRAGVSQLTNLGLTDLIASTPDQFVALAAGLANDTARLGGLRSTLRERMRRSPLMDSARFARAVGGGVPPNVAGVGHPTAAVSRCRPNSPASSVHVCRGR